MRQFTFSASAPALAIVLLVAAAAPAAAFHGVQKETLNALPDADRLDADAKAAAKTCIEQDGDACRDDTAERGGAHTGALTAPAVGWLNAFAADPAAVLQAEVAFAVTGLEQTVAAWQTWLGYKLEEWGLASPDDEGDD